MRSVKGVAIFSLAMRHHCCVSQVTLNPMVYVTDANTLLVFPWRPRQALERTEDNLVTAAVTTTPYAILDTDQFVPIDTSGASNITNLPTPSATYAGFTVTIKKTTADANTVTVKCASGNIDATLGTTGDVISVPWESRTYVCDGTNYLIK